MVVPAVSSMLIRCHSLYTTNRRSKKPLLFKAG